MTLLLATKEDIEELTELINLAYREENGWTQEHELVEGKRVYAYLIEKMIEDKNQFLFLLKEQKKVIGSILVERKEAFAYIGLFTVLPTLQQKGVGKKMLEEAEKFVKNELKLDSVQMAVIAERTELVAYYERRGYSKLNCSEPYPKDAKVGVPKKSLTIEYLEKKV